MSQLLFVRIVLVIMFVIPGLIAFISGVMGSRWFFSTQGTSFFRKQFGLGGARLFYILLGLLLIACGIYGIIDPDNLTPKK